MKRIVVIGNSGAGKSTLAESLSKILGFPRIELDSLHWEPNWKEADLQTFRERVESATEASGTWVCDGNYRKVRDIVWKKADTVIWLDYSLFVVFLRIVWRTLLRILCRKTLWNGNKESFAMAFSKESVILWSLSTHARHKKEFPELFALPEYSHLKVIHFKTPSETELWLRNLQDHLHLKDHFE